MEPSFFDGSWTVASTNVQNLQRGDVVIVRIDGQEVMKRIVALPGDPVAKVNYQSGLTSIGPEYEYSMTAISEFQRRGLLSKTSVPQGMVFVIGDNSRESIDSRLFGAIPIRDIHLRIVQSRLDSYDQIVRSRRVINPLAYAKTLPDQASMKIQQPYEPSLPSSVEHH
jgi:signal peptidase I